MVLKRILTRLSFFGVILACLAPWAASQQPIWGQYGFNAQHTTLSGYAAQRMKRTLWQTTIDLAPPPSDAGLPGHYGTPLIGHFGTIVVPIRTGAKNNNVWPTVQDTFKVQGYAPNTGKVLWNMSTDYVSPPHDWIPPMGCCIGPDNELFVPGAGGTILVRSSADRPAATVKRICFFGLGNYDAAAATYNNGVFISTPITVDSKGDLFFGFRVTDKNITLKNPVNNNVLYDGIAGLYPNGDGTYNGTWWTARGILAYLSGGQYKISGYTFGQNCAPAVSNDGAYVYIAGLSEDSSSSGDYDFTFVLDSRSLSPLGYQRMWLPNLPQDSNHEGLVFDDSTSCPMVGPDDDVYMGCWWFNGFRGFMLHYDKTLATTKPAGSFGWDDTPAVVPSNIVAAYKGSSPYLILTKYNFYTGAPGQNGTNYISIQDPNDGTYPYYYYNYTNSSQQLKSYIMRPIIQILGPTKNTDPGATGVREWCINSAAIDPVTKAAVINSEDGHAYRWDLTTNTLVDNLQLAPPTGEPYTPTIIAADGMCFAMNDEKLAAMVDDVSPYRITLSGASYVGGDMVTGTLTLTTPATGPGASFTIASTNPAAMPAFTVQVPNGKTSVAFSIPTHIVASNVSLSFTATRYDRSLTSSAFNLLASSLVSLVPSANQVVSGLSITGTVGLASKAPTGGRSVSLSSSSTLLAVPATVMVPSGSPSATFAIKAGAASIPTLVKVTAKLGSASYSSNITVEPAVLNKLALNPTSVVGGYPVEATLGFQGTPASSGLTVGLSYGAYSNGPSTFKATPSALSFSVNTAPVNAATTATLKATLNGNSASAVLTVRPFPALASVGFSPTSVFMTYSSLGWVTLNSAAPPGGSSVTLSGTPSFLSFPPAVLVPAGATRVTFTAATKPVDAVTTVTMGASYRGGSQSTKVAVYPILVSKYGLSSSTVTGGHSLTGQITVNHVVNGPLTIHLSSGSAYATVPAAVTIPIGGTAVSFTIQTKAVTASTQVNLYATAATAASRVTSVLTVQP